LFKVEPVVQDINEIKNEDGLRLERDANGNIFFVTLNQDIPETKSYHLNYQGLDVDIKIIVPDAGFTMNIALPNIVGRLVLPTLTLKTKQTDADEYRWRITTVTGASFDFTGREVALNYGQLNVGPGTQLTIVSVVNYRSQTGVNCQDSKEYVLTEAIFRNHLNKGEFDNTTPE
jgi:hypothetical protein